jgi:predicted transcriptional regulator
METVFRVTFQLPSRLPKPPKPKPTYRNPIFRAKEYARMIENGQTESEIASKTGLSRARVCQYLRLLNLDDQIINAIEKLGDPLTKRMMTERLLRPYLTKNPKEQERILKFIASRKPHT